MREYLELQIEDLLLDTDNPRLVAVDSQAEALKAIFDLNPRHFRTMMKSVVEKGTDPGDSFYVIETEEEGDYMVLDGNRRTAAMKVLNNPDLLEGLDLSASQQKSLRKVAVDFERAKVEPVRCVLFDSRDEANEWIMLRHANQQDGEGRIPWGPTEIRRFEGDHTLIDLLTFVGKNANYSDEEWEELKQDIEGGKSTTLSRVTLESPAGREHLGLSVEAVDDKKEVFIEKDPGWVVSVLQKILADVNSGKITSRSMNTASSISDYYASLPQKLQPSSEVTSKKARLKEISAKGDDGSTDGKKPQKGKKKRLTPKDRRTLAPKKHEHEIPSADRGQRLLREAAYLDCEKFPVAAAFLLRAFIEHATHTSAKSLGVPTGDADGQKHLSKLIEEVLGEAFDQKKARKSDFKSFRTTCLTAGPTSIQSLNGFVHSKFAVPTGESLRVAWQSSVPLFQLAFGEPK